MDKVRKELNDDVATRMVIEVNSLAQWLSLYDARRTSEVNSTLIESLSVLEKQCVFTRDKLEFHHKQNNK